MKKVLALIMSLVMFCPIFPAFSVIAAENEYDLRTDPDYLAKWIYTKINPGDNTVLQNGMALYKAGDSIGALKCFRNNLIEKYRKSVQSYYPGLLPSERLSFIADVVCGKRSLSDYNSEYPKDTAFDDCMGAFGSPYTERKINWVGAIGKTTSGGGITFYDEAGEAALVFIGVMGAAYYSSGGEKIYIDKFFQVMEDFAVNCKRDIEAYEASTPEITGSKRGNFSFGWTGWHANNQRCSFIECSIIQFCKLLPDEGETQMPVLDTWGDLAISRGKANPEYYDLIDPVKLATYVVCMQEDLMPMFEACYEAASYTKNMQDAAAGNAMRQLAWFSEFNNLSKISESANDYISNAQDNIFPDGSMLEQAWNYNDDSAKVYNKIFDNYSALGIPLPEKADYIKNLLTYYTRIKDTTISAALTPLRIGGGSHNLRMPEIWKSETVLDRYKKELGYEFDTNTPLFDSVFFPYGGYACLRSGWNIKDDMTLGTFTANNAGAGHQCYIKNSVWLSAFGRPLIMSGDSETYTAQHLPEDERAEFDNWSLYFDGSSTKKGSTIIVNGKNQRGKSARSTEEVPILDSLFLDGTKFDYIDGNFDQGYDGIDDVTHKRQNFYVRDAGLWIITDTMSNDGSSPKNYTQIWRFPARVNADEALEQGKIGLVSPKEGYTLTGFRNDEVLIDEDNRTIKTQDKGAVNIFLSQFSNEALKYKKYFGSKGNEKDGDGLYRGWTTAGLNSSRVPCADVYVNWTDNNSKDSQVMTFAMPSKTDEKPYKQLKNISDAENNITGFEVVTNDGVKVTSLSAAIATKMEVSGICAEATNLVICDKNGEISGIALGCEEILTESGNVKTEEKNFEFILKDGNIEIIDSLIKPHSFGWVDTEEGKYYPRYDAFTNKESSEYLQAFSSLVNGIYVIKYSEVSYLAEKLKNDLDKVVQLYSQIENLLMTANKQTVRARINQFREKILEIAAFYDKTEFNKKVAVYLKDFSEKMHSIAEEKQDKTAEAMSSDFLATGLALEDGKYKIDEYLNSAAELKNSGSFIDIAESWAKNDIEYMGKKGFVNGISNNTFNPDGNMTRAQFVAVLMRIIGKTGQYVNEFSDISVDDWFANGIAAAVENGIVSGDNGMFRPNDPVTREEVAKIISVALGLEDVKPVSYADYENISDWAVGYVATANNSLLMKGYPDGSFRPMANITRAEATVLLKRVYEKIKQ